MATIFKIDRPNNKITLGTTGTTIEIASHTASRLLALDASKDLTVKTIGTDVQAWDASLDSIAGLTYASDSFIKVTAEDTYAIRTISETKTDLSLNNVENTAHSTDAHIMSIDGRDVSVDGTKLDGIEALADVTATSETSHADVVQDGDFGSNGILNRTGAGAYSILALGTDVQAFGAILDDLNTLGANAADSEFLVGTGAGALAWESGATVRTSIGLGTGDSPQFTGIELGHISDTTITRPSAGNLNIEGNLVYRAGGTDVPIGDGGTGQSTAQAAIDALTQVSGATNEHVLTKDTATGNAIWKVAAGGADAFTVKIDAGATAGYIGAANSDGVLRAGTSLSYIDGGNFVTLNTIQDIQTSATPTFAGLKLSAGWGQLQIYESDAAEDNRNWLIDANNNILRISAANDAGDTIDQAINITRDGVSILDIRFLNPVKIKEQAAADIDTVGYGQIWVKTVTPNELWFTNDVGTDVRLGGGYVDRGSATVSDFDEGDSPVEATWTDLDLGPNGLDIVPAGAKAVCLFLAIKDTATARIVKVRKNGTSSELPGNIGRVYTQVADIPNYNNCIIGCDSDGVIEYFVTAGVDEFDITVTGWFL